MRDITPKVFGNIHNVMALYLINCDITQKLSAILYVSLHIRIQIKAVIKELTELYITRIGR